jgi:predicted transcriptional regulator YdeE
MLKLISIFLVLMTPTWAQAPQNLLERMKQHMEYAREKKERKMVIGISMRTANDRFLKEAPPLWDRFFKENLSDKIPNKINKNLLAVYTEYAGDYTQPYTYIIGCEVSSLEVVPEGMVGVTISASPYAVFTSKGPHPQSMMQTWQAIWNSDVKRSYTTDFEVYGPGFQAEKNPEIKVYIAAD